MATYIRTSPTRAHMATMKVKTDIGESAHAPHRVSYLCRFEFVFVPGPFSPATHISLFGCSSFFLTVLCYVCECVWLSVLTQSHSLCSLHHLDVSSFSDSIILVQWFHHKYGWSATVTPPKICVVLSKTVDMRLERKKEKWAKQRDTQTYTHSLHMGGGCTHRESQHVSHGLCLCYMCVCVPVCVGLLFFLLNVDDTWISWVHACEWS